MRTLDPRLLERARAARLLLGIDTALGLATALLVLFQATLFARIVARAFHGASLGDVSVEIALLVIVFAGRGSLAWGFETAGRRAASTVLSEWESAHRSEAFWSWLVSEAIAAGGEPKGKGGRSRAPS